MKNILKKIKALNGLKAFIALDSIIEHSLFKPLAVSLITCFVLANGFDYVQNYLEDRQETILKRKATTPVTINISDSGVRFDIDEDQVIDRKVRQGDTLLKILLDTGASEADVFNILSAMKKVYSPKSITVNDHVLIKYKVRIGYDKKDTDGAIGRSVIINSVVVLPSPEQKISISRKGDEYEAKEIKINLKRYISRYYGVLKNGLFVDGVEAGISPTSMMNMIKLYSYDIDFQRDIKNGDKFEMLVESFYNEDGKKVKDGNVLYSSLILQNRKIETYMHRINGSAEYFDALGNSIRKSLLRTPINGARISSAFGLRRHPILGYSKMHKGVDFAAPTGTPIFAAGSGTITHYGVKGGYGNFVMIKHNSEYFTGYGHASKFVKKLHVGSKVRQGEVIAYVGSTGRSTGPHLHFEILYKGSAINPAKVKATSGLRLGGKDLAGFKATKAEIDNYRKTIPNQINR